MQIECGIRAAGTGDAEAIARIYSHYVLNTVVAFEEEAISAAQMMTRIDAAAAASMPWFVAERAGEVVGYANATKWKGRCAYRYSAEVGLYVAPEAVGRGIGTRLMGGFADGAR